MGILCRSVSYCNHVKPCFRIFTIERYCPNQVPLPPGAVFEMPIFRVLPLSIRVMLTGIDGAALSVFRPPRMACRRTTDA